MNIANALRALLAVAESAHEYLMSDDSVAADDAGAQQAEATIANARAALAAHDATVAAGGWTIGEAMRPLSDETGSHMFIAAEDGFRVCAMYGDGTMNKGRTQANAARIVACVNACQGIADPSRLAPALWNLVASARHTGVAIDPEAVAEVLS